VNVIEVKGLGKKYRIGKAEKKSETLVGSIVNGLKQPLENLRKIRSLTRLNDEEDIVWALRDVSFDVKEGEVLGIIGHNGAGKSTLLKILSRITEPSVGEVQIKGRVAALLEVGTGFHPELTGRENVYMNGTILGMRKKEIDRKLDEIVAFSGVEKFLDTPVKFYSSGMRVRLGFSVAAHLEPEILIIDEVLAVGDAEFQRKCLGKMQDVSNNQGRTVLFVSHNMGAVETLCHKAILINRGTLEGIGQTDEIIKQYLTKEIKYFRKKRESSELNFFRSIVLLNHELEETDIFSHTEKIGLEVEIQLAEWSNDLELALSVKNSVQRRIFTKNIQLQEFTQGEGVFCFRVFFEPGYLMAGEYTFMVYINKPRVKAFDLQESICPFTIVDTGSVFSKYGSKMGDIFPPDTEIKLVGIND
jgi:lipopolysaccharide transport system ATP-binding protein